jgi:hypothetical protein
MSKPKSYAEADERIAKLEAENARLKAELGAWEKGDRWLDNGDVMATSPLGALEAE